MNNTCLTPEPLAPSVYVHAPEAPSPHERSISVTSLFPSPVPSPLPTIAGAGVVRAFSLVAWPIPGATHILPPGKREWPLSPPNWHDLMEGKYEWSFIGKQLRGKGLVK